MKIVKKKVKDLKLAPYNPRYMPEEEKERLKKSIEAFGYVDPIIWNKRTGHVVGGNQRLMVLQEMGVEEVDVVEVDLPLDKEKALNIALNKISGEWEMGKLVDLLDELSTVGLAELTGWTDEEIEDILAHTVVLDEEWLQETGESEEVATDDEIKNHAFETLQQWASEFIEDWEKLHHPMFITRGIVKFWYLLAKYGIKDMPQYFHWAYHPHLMYTAAKSYSFYDLFKRAARGDEPALNALYFYLKVNNPYGLLWNTLPLAGMRLAGNFPPRVAKQIYNEFATGGRVLDPTHGWGGRLVGFLLSDAKHYTGVDTSPQTAQGVRELADDLLPYEPDKTVSLVCKAFEDVKIQDDYYDLVFTSPPYYDVERYVGGRQPHEVYKSFDEWRDGFFTTLIEKSYRALKTGGILALQVGSQRYPLKDETIKIGKQIGFKLVEIRKAGMNANPITQTDDISGEVIVIMRKP